MGIESDFLNDAGKRYAQLRTALFARSQIRQTIAKFIVSEHGWLFSTLADALLVNVRSQLFGSESVGWAMKVRKTRIGTNFHEHGKGESYDSCGFPPPGGAGDRFPSVQA
jgi:hypothetical protein